MFSTLHILAVQYRDTNRTHINIKENEFIYLARKRIQTVTRIWDYGALVNDRVSTSPRWKA